MSKVADEATSWNKADKKCSVMSYCWMMTTSGVTELVLISTAFVGEIM